MRVSARKSRGSHVLLRNSNLLGDIDLLLVRTSFSCTPTPHDMNQNPQYTVLRIKRKATEPPLSSLGASA